MPSRPAARSRWAARCPGTSCGWPPPVPWFCCCSAWSTSAGCCASSGPGVRHAVLLTDSRDSAANPALASASTLASNSKPDSGVPAIAIAIAARLTVTTMSSWLKCDGTPRQCCSGRLLPYSGRRTPARRRYLARRSALLGCREDRQGGLPDLWRGMAAQRAQALAPCFGPPGPLPGDRGQRHGEQAARGIATAGERVDAGCDLGRLPLRHRAVSVHFGHCPRKRSQQVG